MTQGSNWRTSQVNVESPFFSVKFLIANLMAVIKAVGTGKGEFDFGNESTKLAHSGSFPLSRFWGNERIDSTSINCFYKNWEFAIGLFISEVKLIVREKLEFDIRDELLLMVYCGFCYQISKAGSKVNIVSIKSSSVVGLLLIAFKMKRIKPTVLEKKWCWISR